MNSVSPSALYSSSSNSRNSAPLDSPLENASLSISPGPSSPALSNARKRRSSRSMSNERQDAKRICEDEEKFENLLSLVTQERSEEQIFCNFLQSRLEKLEKKYYMRITHTIIQEVMKIELEQSLDQS